MVGLVDTIAYKVFRKERGTGRLMSALWHEDPWNIEYPAGVMTHAPGISKIFVFEQYENALAWFNELSSLADREIWKVRCSAASIKIRTIPVMMRYQQYWDGNLNAVGNIINTPKGTIGVNWVEPLELLHKPVEPKLFSWLRIKC